MEPFIIAFGIASGVLCCFKRIIVREGRVAILYRNGRYAERLSAGRYFRYRPGLAVEVLDIRKKVLTVAGQEVLSADNVGLKLSVVVSYEIADPVLALEAVEDYSMALYASIQLALRATLAAMKSDELLVNRAEIGARTAALAAGPIEETGLRLLTLEVRDIMFPNEFKRAFAEVIKAKQEGLAALERARSESAVLRSLANTARLLESQPALMNLRMLQSMDGATGKSLVVGIPNVFSPMGGATKREKSE